MRKVLLTVITILMSLMFHIDAFSEPIPNEVRKCVAFIVKPGAERNKPIATGFFIGYKYDENPNKIYIFLVTARHALIDDKGMPHTDLLLRMNDKKTGGAKDFNLINPKAWFLHEKIEKSVDIAVQPLFPKEADFLVIPPKYFVTEELLKNNNIGIGDDVFFTGLLSYHSGSTKISPIVRFGKLALLTNEKTVDDKYYHFLDSGNIPGHSGSPVFLWTTPTRRQGKLIIGSRIFGLYGVVSGMLEYKKALEVTVPKQTRKQIVPVDARSSGITAIVPIKYLFEILEGYRLKKVLGILDSK